MMRLRTIALRLTTLPLVVVALAMLFGIAPAYASAVSGTIKGTVVDDGGLAIPGALISLSSPKLIGGNQQRSTDDNGDFIFVELPPGRYDLTAQKQGFGQVNKNNLDVVIGRVTTVSIEMKYGGETVVVEGERKVVDTESVSKGATFTKDFLSRIPSGRSYQSAIMGTAGIALSDGGNPMAAGAAGNENTYLVDGVNVTDPVTGTFSNNFNFDAIDEIQVLTGGFDPEYAAIGAVVSIVTESGGNTLSYAVRADYTNGDWGPKTDGRYAADGFQISPTAFDQSNEAGSVSAVVSGPLLRDRIWFIGAYKYDRTVYRSIGVDLPRDYDGHAFFGKLTAQPSSSHRFSLSFQADPAAIDNVDGDSFTRPEARIRQYQSNWMTALKWNWFVNPEANLETTASMQRGGFKITQVPCTHDRELGYNACDADEQEGTIDYDTPARAGVNGAYNSDNAPYFAFDERWRTELSTKFSVLQVDFFGKHDLKAGLEGNYSTWNQIYGYHGNLYFVDLYTNAFDPDTYQNYYWLETSGYSQYVANGYHVGAFVQDVYKPIENLTFRYGVRYDRGVVNNDAGEPIIDVGLFGPRIYSSWDPWGDEKTKFYGGYGRSNDTGRLDVGSYLSQSGYGNHYFYGDYPYGNFTSDASYNAGDYDTSNTVTIADNISAPYADEFTLGAEREVVPDIRAGLVFTGKFTRNVYTLDETNLIFDEDGFSYIGASTGSVQELQRLRTPVVARRDYYQIDLTLGRRYLVNRWVADLTLSYVKSLGTTQYSLDSSLSNPSQVELMYGNLDTDVNWQAKLDAAWDLPLDPWTTTVGFRGQLFSGTPFSRYYYSGSSNYSGTDYDLLKEAAGTYGRSNWTYYLDLQVIQAIPVDQGKLEIIGELQNFTNAQFPLGEYQYYINAENRYVLYNRRDPIAVNLALRYEY